VQDGSSERDIIGAGNHARSFFFTTDQDQNPAKFGLAKANPAKSSKEPARSGLAGPIPGVRQPIGASPGGGPRDGRPGRTRTGGTRPGVEQAPEAGRALPACARADRAGEGGAWERGFAGEIEAGPGRTTEVHAAADQKIETGSRARERRAHREDERRPAGRDVAGRSYGRVARPKKLALNPGSDTMLGRCNLYYLGAKGHNI
jgi:hypothetical protein